MLDEIDSSRPFGVWGASIHKLTLNSKAIEYYQVNDLPKDTFGFLQDENGKSTGILTEQAMFAIANKILGVLTPEQIIQGTQSVLAQGRRKGVTSCIDMGVGIGMPLEAELQLLNALDSIPNPNPNGKCNVLINCWGNDDCWWFNGIDFGMETFF